MYKIKLMMMAVLLTAVFSAYGVVSNLVFYSDFENTYDGQPIVSSADLNGATFAPPSPWPQVGTWVISPYTSFYCRSGAVSQVLFLNMKAGGGVTGILSEPALFKESKSVRFSYDFKCNGGSQGLGHIITGYDSNNSSVFTIRMGGMASSPQYMVTVNGTPIGIASQSSSATHLNSISLMLSSTGIDVTLINGATSAKTTNHVAILGGTNLASFAVMIDGVAANAFDYDNFEVWAISPGYTLTVNNGNGGGTYANGTQVAISADVVSGKAFVQWIGDTQVVASVTSANTTVTMSTNAVTLTATYVDAYTLTINSGGGDGTYTNGTQVVISADAVSGRAFVQWIGATQYVASVTSSTTTVTIPAQAVTLTATYTNLPDWYTLTVNSGSGGGVYTNGRQGVIAANAIRGKAFVQWTGDTQYVASVTSSITIVTMPAWAISLTATYMEDNTKNLVFYSDFENADDAAPIVTSGDLNGATVAPPSLYDQIPQNGWAIGTLGNITSSQFRTGASSPIVAYIQLKASGGATGTPTAPALFQGAESVRFSYDFKCNGGSKGVGHIITGYDSNNSPVFTIKMGGLWSLFTGSSTPFQVTVNEVPIGIASRSSSSAAPLNSISLTLDSTGISATLINSSTLVPITVSGIPAGGGANFAKFGLSLDGSGPCAFDYDNFQVYEISPGYTLTVNSGTGDGLYTNGTQVAISADAVPGKAFVQWIGDTQVVASVTSANTTVTMSTNAVTLTATYMAQATFVTIGHPGNATDTTGYGAVGYTYKISATEVTIAEFQRATCAGNGNENVWNDGTRTVGSNAPASNVSLYEAMKYCNWLTSGNVSNGAYQFDGGGVYQSTDRASAITTFRTVYALPTEDEWYKAAYFKTDASGYSLYANGTGTAPSGIEANYNANGNYTAWTVGSGLQEQNGTYDMMGNVWEWTEAPSVVYRGGSSINDENSLRSSYRGRLTPLIESSNLGFRVVAISGAALTVNGGSGSGSYINGAQVAISANVRDGWVFTRWIGTTQYVASVTSSTTTVTMSTNSVTLTATYVTDNKKPTLKITSPTDELKVLATNGLYTVRGTAADNLFLTNVLVQLNSGTWTNASTTNGWKNWSLPVELIPGKNTIRAYSEDLAMNRSPIKFVECTYVPGAVMTVQINGAGTITPDYAGDVLKIGKRYTMRATAAKKSSVFTGWTYGIGGSVASNKRDITFVMQSNLVLTANFNSILERAALVSAALAVPTTAQAAIVVDGSAKDWANVPRSSFSYASVTQEVAVALDGNNIALLLNSCPFNTSDNVLVYFKLRFSYGNDNKRHSVDLWTSGSVLYGMVDGKVVAGLKAVLLNGVLEVKLPVDQAPSQVTIEEIGCGMDLGSGTLTELFKLTPPTASTK